MTSIDTAELERLAESITPGEWYAHETHPQNACAYVSARREFMDHDIATLYHGESDNAGQDEAGIWGDHPERRANARAIALAPALLREVLARRKAEAGMRALLLAGCELMAVEAEGLRNSIRIVGNPDRMSDAPEDAHAVEAIREMEDWIASVKATLYPPPPKPREGKMQNDAKLLPCPFCGGEAKVYGPVGWYRQYGISHSCRVFYGGSGDFTLGAKTEDEAVAQWNRRADLCASGQVRALMDASEYLAREYEKEGFPSYANLARQRSGIFTLCSIRAIEKAQSDALTPAPQAATPTAQEAVAEALKLAAARLQRLALEIPSTTSLRADAFEWADEALRALKGNNHG